MAEAVEDPLWEVLTEDWGTFDPGDFGGLADAVSAFQEMLMRNARITLFAVRGVPILEEKTRPCSCQSSPALNRSFSCRFMCSRSASTQRCGNARVLLDFSVLVSPP